MRCGRGLVQKLGVSGKIKMVCLPELPVWLCDWSQRTGSRWQGR